MTNAIEKRLWVWECRLLRWRRAGAAALGILKQRLMMWFL